MLIWSNQITKCVLSKKQHQQSNNRRTFIFDCKYLLFLLLFPPPFFLCVCVCVCLFKKIIIMQAMPDQMRGSHCVCYASWWLSLSLCFMCDCVTNCIYMITAFWSAYICFELYTSVVLFVACIFHQFMHLWNTTFC